MKTYNATDKRRPSNARNTILRCDLSWL